MHSFLFVSSLEKKSHQCNVHFLISLSCLITSTSSPFYSFTAAVSSTLLPFRPLFLILSLLSLSLFPFLLIVPSLLSLFLCPHHFAIARLSCGLTCNASSCFLPTSRPPLHAKAVPHCFSCAFFAIGRSIVSFLVVHNRVSMFAHFILSPPPRDMHSAEEYSTINK